MIRWAERWFRKSPPANPLLVQVRSGDPGARTLAAAQLAFVTEPWAAEELVTLLADPATAVRQVARDALRQQGKTAQPALLAGLNHPRLEVSVVAAELLGELRSPEAVESLLVALKYSERPVQLAARRALERCGPAAVPALRAALTEPQPWVRAQIEGALAAVEAAPANSVHEST